MLSEYPRSNRLSLNKAVLWLLWAGFLMLLADIRVEHNQVFHESWHAYVPMVFSGIMLFAIPAGIALWYRGGRKFLIACFLISAVVGGAGFVFHMKEKPAAAISNTVKILMSPIPSGKPGLNTNRVVGNEAVSPAPGQANVPQGLPKRGPKWPPLLAPLAFVGLGLLGLLSCMRLPADPATAAFTRGATSREDAVLH